MQEDKKVHPFKRIQKGKIKRPQAKALREELYRRRFLVPNLVTLGNLFCGYLAIIYASSFRFEKAAIAIGIALLLDGLDGRVARRLNATSPFGLEFDSFADLISFGIAPAIIVYHLCFQTIANDFGTFISFIYVLCAASRLVRFNLDAASLKKFDGLPTPGAAGVIAACTHLIPTAQSSQLAVIVASALTLSLSALMISKIEFFSIKSLQVQSISLYTKVALGAMIGLLWYNNKVGLVVVAVLYALSGPFKYLTTKKEAVSQEQEDEVSEVS